MSKSSATLERQWHAVQTTDPTTPSRMLERPPHPSTGPPAPEPEPERRSRLLGWVAALASKHREQWDADLITASAQAWEMMSRCSTRTQR